MAYLEFIWGAWADSFMAPSIFVAGLVVGKSRRIHRFIAMPFDSFDAFLTRFSKRVDEEYEKRVNSEDLGW